MRLFGILILLCFTFGTVSAFSFPNLFDLFISWFQSTINEIIPRICSYLYQHPNRAETTLQKINETLEATNQTIQIFNATINYLNSPLNQYNLVGGNSTCPGFFSGLKAALTTDLNNAKADSADKQQQAQTTVTNFINQLITIYG